MGYGTQCPAIGNSANPCFQILPRQVSEADAVDIQIGGFTPAVTERVDDHRMFRPEKTFLAAAVENLLDFPDQLGKNKDTVEFRIFFVQPPDILLQRIKIQQELP